MSLVCPSAEHDHAKDPEKVEAAHKRRGVVAANGGPPVGVPAVTA